MSHQSSPVPRKFHINFVWIKAHPLPPRPEDESLRCPSVALRHPRYVAPRPKIFHFQKKVYIPESSCGKGSVGVQAFHAAQVFWKVDTSAVPIVGKILLSLSTNCKAKPSDACHAIWQCISQEPGLSIWKAITRCPPVGSVITSRRGGFTRLSAVVAV